MKTTSAFSLQSEKLSAKPPPQKKKKKKKKRVVHYGMSVIVVLEFAGGLVTYAVTKHNSFGSTD